MTPWETLRLLSKQIPHGPNPQEKPAGPRRRAAQWLLNGLSSITVFFLIIFFLIMMVFLNFPFYVAHQFHVASSHVSKNQIAYIEQVGLSFDDVWDDITKRQKIQILGHKRYFKDHIKQLVDEFSKSSSYPQQSSDQSVPSNYTAKPSHSEKQSFENFFFDNAKKLLKGQYFYFKKQHTKNQAYQQALLNVGAYICDIEAPHCDVLWFDDNEQIWHMQTATHPILRTIPNYLSRKKYESQQDFEFRIQTIDAKTTAHALFYLNHILEAQKNFKEDLVTVRTDRQDIAPMITHLGRLFSSFIAHVIFIFLAWFGFFATGVTGWQWDRQRYLGYLESFTLVQQPIWVLYVGDFLKSIKWWTLFYIGAMVLALLWRLPVSWFFVVSLGLLTPCVMLLLGFWGMLATVLFHHSKGRMFARVCLSPVSLLLTWSIRIFIITAVLSHQHPVLIIDFYDTLLARSWMMLPGALVCLVLAYIVHLLVVWRIGPRREGLRKIQA